MKIRSIHPFPARMAPSIALEALPYANGKPLRVLDPMVGSGTTAVIARSRGHIAYGFDADPLAIILSKAWTLNINESLIYMTAENVLLRARIIYKELKQRDSYPINADEKTKKFIRFWFNVTSRKQLRSLSEAIFDVEDENIKCILWSAFSRLIIAKNHGASWAMDLSHSRPHKVIDKTVTKPFEHFLKEIVKVVGNIPFKTDDIDSPAASIELGDARKISVPDSSIDIVITSPPYLNAIDYIRCSKFTLVWMGYQISSLSSIRSSNIGTEATRGINENDDYIAQVMDVMIDTYQFPVRQKRIIAKYIADLDDVIKEVARVMTKKGHAIFVIGNCSMKGMFIKNSEAIKQIGRKYGLHSISEKIRILPDNRRYLPPPTYLKSGANMQKRMNEEVVLSLSFH